MPVFRKVVTLEKRPEEAWLTATALGVYDITVNGKRVEGHELKPGWTDYRKEVTCQALDITALLHKGENEIHAQLSHGWWSGEISRGVYGRNTPLAFKAALEVNGQAVALTDETWQCSHDGPLLLGDIYDGEMYDARRVPTNWKNVQTVTYMDMAVIPFEGPEVHIPISPIKKFTLNLMANVDSIEYTITTDGDTLKPNADGLYTPTYGTYMIKATKPGYRCFRTELTIGDDSEDEQTCIIEMVKADESGWDGVTLTEPALVDGIYHISSGAELAWLAAQVNGGDYKISAKLINDIDLCSYDWTPIGGSKSSTAYQGTFEGDGHTVDGLYINNTNTYQALFGYIKGSHISGITVTGEVSAKQYVAGVVAYMGTKTYIDRCANKAKVTGTSTYVGGVTGSVSQTTAQLTSSYNLGNIKGTTNCGGVAGYNNKSAVIENVFSLGEVTGNTVAACIGGTTAKDKALNVFATKEYDIIEGQTTVTSGQMLSGEVAYLLGEAYGQQIGTDAHPVLGGAKVYKVTYTTNLSEEADSLYTNGQLPQLESPGYLTVWKTAPDGEELTEITADTVLYAEYRAILVDSITLSHTVLTLTEGDTLSLTAVVTPDDAADKALVWASSDTLVLVVDTLGKVTAIAPGTAIITATAIDGSGVSASCEVTVQFAKYVITYLLDGELFATDTLPRGTAIVVPEVSEKEGHTFSGWGEVAEVVPAADLTYEGSYIVNTYKVHYYVGEELVHTVEVPYGQAMPEYVYEPSTEGEIFIGWTGDTYETMPACDVVYIAEIAVDGINSLVTDGKRTTVIYDMQGYRVTNTNKLKGIFIVNGRKVIIK